MPANVSPRGCSRAFIIRVLTHALSYVSRLFRDNSSVSFPFPPEEVVVWMAEAKGDCLHMQDLQEAVGGAPFECSSPETYWTKSAQFQTWWKNNIERKAKFQGLIRDADSSKPGVITGKSKRSFYCRMVVALAINIRNHFAKYIAENAGLVQVTVPSLDNMHPTLERHLIPIDSPGVRKSKARRLSQVSESSLDGLDLLSHTITTQDSGFGVGEAKKPEGELDESDVLGMGGLLSLRAYNPEADAVTFCENIYNRSIPGKDKKRTRDGRTSRQREAAELGSLIKHGFGLVQSEPGGPVTICGIQTGSAIRSFGIRNGDVVTHLDGRSVAGRTAEEVLLMLSEPRASEERRLDTSSSSEDSSSKPSNALQTMCHIDSHQIPSFLRLGWMKRKAYERSREEFHRKNDEGYIARPITESVFQFSNAKAEVGTNLIKSDQEAQIDEGEQNYAGQTVPIPRNSEEIRNEQPPQAKENQNKDKATSLVSSIGCSRAFITCVLARALEHVKAIRCTSSISFPFATSDITDWLRFAAHDCTMNIEYQLALGGTQFDASNPSTYWTSPNQFLTWWKNNIERKSKLLSLQRDAASAHPGDYSARARRALYCRIAVALAINIRNHFDRVIAENKGLIQVPIPSLTNTHPATSKSCAASLGNEENCLMDSIGLHLVDEESMFEEDRDQDETLRQVMYSLNEGNDENDAAFSLNEQ